MEYPKSCPMTQQGKASAHIARINSFSPKFECSHCHQIFSLDFGDFVESNDFRLGSEEAEPHFVCRECVKNRRPSVKDWLNLTPQEIDRLSLRCLGEAELRRLKLWTLESVRDWGPEYFITELYNIDLDFLETPNGEKFLEYLGVQLSEAIFKGGPNGQSKLPSM